MAVVPISGSSVFFLKGVPFSNDNKHTRYFDNKGEQDSYFDGRTKVHAMSETVFQQNDGRNYVRADASIDSLRDVSYMMFTNTEYSNKRFYCFVTELKRKNSTMTEVYFEIDVLQTWFFQIQFKPSFVVREHCPLWNEDGSPVVNTIDEGLDYGSDYHTVKVMNYNPNDGLKFIVITLKNLIHGTDNGKTKASTVGIAQPLSIYILPFNNEGLPTHISSGDKDLKIDDVLKVLTNMYKLEKFTNNIASMYITDSIGISYTVEKGDAGYELGFHNPDDKLELVTVGTEGDSFNLIYIEEAKSFGSIKKDLGKKYDGYREVKESKLLMHPYTVLTMDDMQGNRRDFKNEYIYDNNLTVVMKGSMGTSNKVSFAIDSYNMNQDFDFKHLMNDENAIIVNNPNDVTIITDLLSAYIQGNRNSLEVQRTQIYANGAFDTMGGALYATGSGFNGNPTGMGMGLNQAFSSAVNTQLSIEGMEAKKKDIGNMPPQIQSMGSNVSYTIGNGYSGVYLLKKQIKVEYQQKLEDYFGAFGYKVHKIKSPNLHTRKSWNYIETKSCNIIGDFNTEDLNEIKSIFDNGITLWHTNDMMNYSLSNEVI